MNNRLLIVAGAWKRKRKSEAKRGHMVE